MNIVIVYQYFQSEESPGHTLNLDLALHLKSQGHDVYVIAGRVGYMSSRENAGVAFFDSMKIYTENVNGVKVIRVPSYNNRHHGYISRVLNYVTFMFGVFRGVFNVPRPDVVYASSPPIFAVYGAAIAARLRKVPFILEVCDLWPGSIVDLGLLRSRIVISVLRSIERYLYDKSRLIVTLTRGIRDDIVRRGWPSEKVVVERCGINLSSMSYDAETSNDLRGKLNLTGKRIVLYMGTHGVPHNLEVVIDAAERLIHRKDIVFLFVGDGMNKPNIQKLACSKQLPNVVFLDCVPKRLAASYIGMADIGLAILQDVPVFHGAIPTKMLDYMALKKPVLIGIRGEAEALVKLAGSGLSFDPSDSLSLSECVVEMLESDIKLKELGDNGFNFVRKEFSADARVKSIENLIKNIVENRSL